METWERVKIEKWVPGINAMPIDDYAAYNWAHWPERFAKFYAEAAISPNRCGG